MLSASYGYCDLARTTDSLKFLCDKAFNIAKNQKYDEYQRGLSLMILWIFCQIQFPDELYRSIVRKF